MQDFETGRIIAALFLGAIVILAMMSAGKAGLSRTLKQGAVWAVIFVAVVAGFGIWEDIQRSNQPRQAAFADQGRVVVPMHRDGHYYITLGINGQNVDFVVDTGASDIVLTRDDAARVGLDVENLSYFGRANTANGEVRTAPVRLSEVNIGGIRDRDMPAFVNEGEMFRSLLGMTYLQRWSRIEIADGELVLTR